MHKIKDTSITPLQPDACIPEYTCFGYMCQLKRSVRDAKKIELPELHSLRIQCSNIQNIASVVQCSPSHGFIQQRSFWTYQCYIAICSVRSVAVGVATAFEISSQQLCQVLTMQQFFHIFHLYAVLMSNLTGLMRMNIIKWVDVAIPVSMGTPQRDNYSLKQINKPQKQMLPTSKLKGYGPTKYPKIQNFQFILQSQN